VFQQTNGISSYSWLAIIGTICFIVVYIMTNIAAPVFARRRNQFLVLSHVVAPIISTIALLIPLASFVLPPLPGIESVFTGLGFAPTPFPLNILPIFVIVWVLIGLVYAWNQKRVNPAGYDRLGQIVGGETDTPQSEEQVAKTAVRRVQGQSVSLAANGTGKATGSAVEETATVSSSAASSGKKKRKKKKAAR
jgi:amino acid transporter